MFVSLEIELNGPVATLWMNRPELHNAFDETLIAELTAAGPRRFVRLGTLDFVLEREASGAGVRRGRGPRGHGGGLEAPMPGVVTRVMVAAGDQVEKGQPLLALEAMKMEHALTLGTAARITAVHVAPGARVAPGQLLLEFEAA